MTLSPILPSHDATTVALDFGVFIARHARRYRTSQTAIIAALMPVIEPVRHESDDRPLTPDAVDRLLKAIDEIEPTPQPETPPPAADTPDHASGEATDGAARPSLPSEPSVAPIPRQSTPQAKTRADVVLAVHRRHPDWPVARIAIETGYPRGTVSAAISAADVSVPTKAQYLATHRDAPDDVVAALMGKPTKRSQLREAHKAHPDWTVHDMAQHLGITPENASTIANHIGITLPRPKKPNKADETTQALKAAVMAPKPPPATPGPPAAHVFAGKSDMAAHYSEVRRRLGK